jgi:hypothetical protein
MDKKCEYCRKQITDHFETLMVGDLDGGEHLGYFCDVECMWNWWNAPNIELQLDI